MGNKKKWMALLTALVVLLSGTMQLYGVEGDNLSHIAATEAETDMQSIVPDDSLWPEHPDQEEPVEEPGAVEPGEDDSGLPDASREEQPEPDVPTKPDSEIQVAESAEGRYVLVVAEPGSDDYREWDNPTVEVGEQYEYDFYFTWYEDGEYQVIPNPQSPTGPYGFFAQTFSSSNFRLFYDDDGWHLHVLSAEAGTHTINTAYTHPDTKQRIKQTLELHVIEQRYVVVFAEPGSDSFKEWDNPKVQVGDNARYALQTAQLADNGTYEIEPGVEWGIHFQESAQFTLELEEDGYYLNVSPVHAGTYSIRLYCTNPVNGFTKSSTLYLHVVERDAGNGLLTVTAPNGKVRHWEEGKVGAMTVHYHGAYDPAQTMTVSSAAQWSLHDPEGVLRQVSDDGEQTVYAMTRPTWEQPCEFRSGDTVMAVFVLLPAEMKARFAVYDGELANNAPEQLPQLADGILAPDRETQLAVLVEMGGATTLLPDPLQIVHFDRSVTTLSEPGEPYFTLVPQEVGTLTLGLERGRSETVWVGAGTPVDIWLDCGHLAPENWGGIWDGDNLKTRVRAAAAAGWMPGTGHLARSSNPAVIEVEVDEDDDSAFFLKPVGLGEAVIYLDSDQFYSQVRLTVTDWQVPMTAVHQDPASIGLPAGSGEWGPAVLPANSFEGTAADPFPLPCVTAVQVVEPRTDSDLNSYLMSQAQVTSSNPEIVEVIQENGFLAYLKPVGSGICTITYQEGPFHKEVVVRSEPDALQQIGCVEPGFYTYYGSAQVRRDTVLLENGLPVTMAIAPVAGSAAREALDSERFAFSEPGVAQVDLTANNLFNLVPVSTGTTTLSYTTRSGEVFALQITVGLPETVWDFVVPDHTAKSGYRLWEGERAVMGDRLEREVYFAQLTLSGDGSIHTLRLLDFPEDLAVTAQDGTAFDLVKRGTSWYACAAPRDEGVSTLTISATPAGSSSALVWEKRLYVSQAIVVSENTVAAINEAIRTAPVQSGYETVILLPTGYIPMDGSTPVLLSRPVTLRGQNTVLASDVVALCTTPGAKLQDLTIRFDDASFYSGDTGYKARITSHFVYSPNIDLDKLLFAIMGNGKITLENCELDGGTGWNRCQYGIAVDGDGVTFQGENTIRNFSDVGWLLYSSPGPRRYVRGLTFAGNRIGVKARNKGSTDPYFIRLIESNFLFNAINVETDFPANFAHNYFSGGDDEAHVTKSPQYMQPLQFNGGGPVQYPSLRIEEDRLASTELLNFEGQAPIDTTNFADFTEPVQIAVRELDAAGVGVTDSSSFLLQWTFPPSQSGDAQLFLPDAYIDETFALPAGSGIETYQGVSFAHHGPLPMAGAEISVRKETLFAEDTLYLYRLADGVLTALGEIDNTAGEFYTFHLDGCSDYIITNVVVESPGDGNGGTDGGGTGSTGSDGDTASTGKGIGSRADDRESALAEEGEDAITTGTDRMASHTASGTSPDGTWDGETPPASGAQAGPGQVPGDEQGADFLYRHIPKPADLFPDGRRTSANQYVDEAAIHAAFAAPQGGQVVVDVGVRTAVSPLAFQLLAENPTYTLVLKGDGYEWRFSGEDISAVQAVNAFDTTVRWQEEGAIAQLGFAGQGTLPGHCTLVLEAAVSPLEWGRYNALQNGYMPCELFSRLEGNRLAVGLESFGDYVAILPVL